jgi:murein DD-endopeptidase MepM/ murein hydrolase activator NlpD
MNKRTIIYVIGVILVGILLYTVFSNDESESVQTPAITQHMTSTQPLAEESTPNDEPKLVIDYPIDSPNTRVTKKSYGTYVTPKNSPVSPEIFTGYHTGLDFETFTNEKDSDVVIKTICDGKLLRKTTATGYGGYAIQSCVINDKDVTVVYGHLRLNSIPAKVGDELKTGDTLGVLGTGYSPETSNERKHLHLSIGTSININGYVQSKTDLVQWMDPKKVLGL